MRKRSTPDTIEEIKTAEDAKQYLNDARCKHNGWDGPGYYAIYSYSQPCPRGCCYDLVKEIIPLQDYLHELQKRIEENQNTLQYWNSVLEGKEDNM